MSGAAGIGNDPPPSPRGDEEEEDHQDPIQVERALDTSTVEWVIKEFKTGSEDLWELGKLLEVEDEDDEEGIWANQWRNKVLEISRLMKGPAMGSLMELEHVKHLLRTAHGRMEPLESQNLDLETQVVFLEGKVRKLSSTVRDQESQLKAAENVTYFYEWKKTELSKRVGLEKEVEELRAKNSELEKLNELGSTSSPPSSDPVPVSGNGTEPLASTSSTPPSETRPILRRKGPPADLREGDPVTSLPNGSRTMTGKENQDAGAGTEGISSSGLVREESALSPDGLRNGRKTVTWWGDSRKSSVKGERFSDASMIVEFPREPDQSMDEQGMGDDIGTGDNAAAAVAVNEDLVGSSGEVTNGGSPQAEQEVEVSADGADDANDSVTNLAMGGVGEESENAARSGIEDACAQGPPPGSQPQPSAGPGLLLINSNSEGDGDNVGSSTNVDKNLAEGVAENLDVVGVECDTGIDSGSGIGHGGGGEGIDVEIGEDSDALASPSASTVVENPLEGSQEDSASTRRHGGDETATGTIPTAGTSEDGDSSGEDKTLDDVMDDDDDDDIIIIDIFPKPTGNVTGQVLSGSNSQVDCQNDNASGNENDGSEMVHDVVDTPPPPPKRTYELRRKRNIHYNLLNRGALVASPPRGLKRKQRKVPEGKNKSIRSSKGKKSVKQPQFQCDKCDAIFTRSHHLERHTKNVHHRQAPEENPKYECGVCQRVYYVKGNYDRHVRSHERVAQGPLQCPECSQVIIGRKRDLERHLLTHDPNRQRNLKCDLCPKMFFAAKNLQMHKKIHSNIRKYKCKTCTMKFKRQHDLTRHMLVHSNVRSFRCTLCPQSFKTQRTLKVHVQRHGEERPFQCKDCGKGFKTTANLGEHVHRVHSGKKPHQCKVCKKAFPYKTDLNRHERRPHPRQ